MPSIYNSATVLSSSCSSSNSSLPNSPLFSVPHSTTTETNRSVLFNYYDAYKISLNEEDYSCLETAETVSSLAYKKVANKIKPVATTLPEEYRIVRRLPHDPLTSLTSQNFPHTHQNFPQGNSTLPSK
jgi:flagellar basal body P-ring protein FlgI